MKQTMQQESLIKQMGMDAAEQAKIKEFVGFTEDDARLLKDLLPLITEHADEIVGQFYANIQRYPELMDLIARAGSTIERLRMSQNRYLISLFEGDYSENYFEQRLKIVIEQTNIGLTPRWYLGSYSVYLQGITPLVMRKYFLRKTKQRRALAAIYKIIMIDSELVIEAYNKKSWDEQLVDYTGQIEAISRSQGVIEFNLDGTIIKANSNFLNLMGYTLDEVEGKHHRMFVEPAYANSAEYRAFWDKLGRGEFDSGEYKRIGKGGKEVWLQSTYNPIFDTSGNPLKIVKYATDITEQKQHYIEYQAHVEEFGAVIAAVAKGDLRHRVKLESHGELKVLGDSLNTMVDSLVHMSSQIAEASNVIFSTLAQLQAAIGSQSAGASQQAAAVNETTSTLEEIKVSSTQTLSKTQQLGEIAERTRKEGEQGLETVGQAVLGIEAIRVQMENIAQTILSLSEQTAQIGEITGVVTTLAQQSKMLALNASIEAAKAGEAGKGFSVVASEVKELAEQSQQSTAQVQKILQDIRHATDRAVMATEEGRKGVDAGVVLVQKSGEVMRQLGEVIHEAGIASQQIVAAVRQEVVGIEQTNTAMIEINKVTNHFVTSTQQSKVAAGELATVAAKLKESVAVYQMNVDELRVPE